MSLSETIEHLAATIIGFSEVAAIRKECLEKALELISPEPKPIFQVKSNKDNIITLEIHGTDNIHFNGVKITKCSSFKHYTISQDKTEYLYFSYSKDWCQSGLKEKFFQDHIEWQRRWYSLAHGILEDKLTPIVKEIIPDFKDIATLNPDNAYDYFIFKGWHTVPKEYFRTFDLAGWIVPGNISGFAHCIGIAINFDWKNKSMTAYGWEKGQ